MKLCNKLLFIFCVISFHVCSAMEQNVYFYEQITSLNFSSDGHSLIVGFISGYIAIVDRADTSIQKKISLYDKPVSSVALDGNDVVIGYANGIVHLKSLHENSYAIFKDQNVAITAVKITPSCIVTGSSDGSVCVRNRMGLLLKKLQVSAGVFTMCVSGDSCYVFIGCDDGSIWRYNTVCGDFEQLVQDLHKGKALCVLTDSRGFYVAYENAEVIYFNLVDKTTKIFKAKYPVYALQIIPEHEVLVGYKGNSIVADEIFDLATGGAYSASCKSDEIYSGFAIQGMNIVVAQAGRISLSRIVCECVPSLIQCLTDGIPLSKVIIRDRDHNICGYITQVQQNTYSSMKLCLRASSVKKGVYVEVVDMRGVSYNFYIYDKLALIDKFIISRELSHGALACVYRKVENKRLVYAHEVQQPEVRALPMDIHTVLHSYNVPLIDAHLIARAGTKYQKIIQGVQVNGNGIVWMFDDTRSMAPYVLKLFSREQAPREEQHEAGIQQDEACPAGQVVGKSTQDSQRQVRVYAWPLLYLSSESELFIQRLSGDRFKLTLFDEATGRQMHYHEYQPSAQA